MRYFVSSALLGLVVLSSACSNSDDPKPDASVVVADAGRPNDDGGAPDGGAPADGGPDAGGTLRLERPGLPRPPQGGLPAELRPPR